jgi:hypothetical protein
MRQSPVILGAFFPGDGEEAVAVGCMRQSPVILHIHFRDVKRNEFRQILADAHPGSGSMQHNSH